jgi:hypothetical protein
VNAKLSSAARDVSHVSINGKSFDSMAGRGKVNQFQCEGELVSLPVRSSEK